MWQSYDIVGSYNNQRYSEIDSERTVNLFEYIDQKGKKNRSLIPTSGLTDSLVDFGTATGGFRGQFVFKDRNTSNPGTRMYQVIGDQIWRVDSSLVPLQLGTLTTNSGYVGIDANTFQIIFVDGSKGYIYDTNTDLFVQITDPAFPGNSTGTGRPIDVCYLDGFFVVAAGDTNNFQLSSFNQGLVWGGVGTSATATFSAGASGNITITGSASNLNFQVGTPVIFSGGGLPAEITAGTIYYVVFTNAPLTTIIRVSATPGGAVITYAAGGVGTITNNGQLQLGQITTHPGTIVACKTLHRRLFLFSQNYTEVWENSGAGTNLPFRRNNTLLMEFGTPAIASVQVGFDMMFFLSQDKGGQSSVMQVIGTQPVPVSNRALDFQLSKYASIPTLSPIGTQINDGTGILIKENGLIFYRLNFTAANHTYVYNVMMSDPSTEEGRRWHEEEILNGDRHLAQTQGYFDGINYYGDYQNPILYIVSTNNSTNDGESIRRMRIGRPVGSDKYKRLRMDRFQLDLVQGQPLIEIEKAPFTVDPATDLFTIGVGFNTSIFFTGKQATLSTSGSLPNPLLDGTVYYVIVISSTTFKLAATFSDAVNMIPINITTAGTPVNVIATLVNRSTNPIVFLSYSKDGGASYGNKLAATMGKIGERSYRTVWRKLGTIPRGQYFVPKIEFFNQIPFVVLGAAWVFEEMPE